MSRMVEDASLRQSSGAGNSPHMPSTSFEASSSTTINPPATVATATTLGKRPREPSTSSFQEDNFDGAFGSNRQGASPRAGSEVRPSSSLQRPRLTARLSDHVKEDSTTPPGQSSTSSAAGNMTAPGQAIAKPQKACVNCRRSKVKCLNVNAEPPCQKCKETGQLCKFQLRSDDYEWRDRTEAMIGRLSDAVEGLVSAQQQHFQQMQVQQQSNAKSVKLPGHAHSATGSSPRNTFYQSPVLGAPTSLPPPHTLAPNAASLYAGGAGPSGIGLSHPRSPSNSTGSAMAPSPGALSNHSSGGGGGGPGINGTNSSMLPPLISSRNAMPASNIPGHQRHGKSPSLTPGRPHRMPSSTSAPSGLLVTPRVSTIPTSQPEHFQSHHRNSADSFAKHWLQPPASSSGTDSSSGQQQQPHHGTSKACQIDPSYTLSQVLKSETPEKITSLTPTRWIVGGSEWENYARPAEIVGRDDPRLNAIGMGLIPADRARWLFIHFAQHLFPHSFGFPTYPASEHMTPLLISSLLAVSSIHHIPSAQYFPALRQDVLANIKPEQASSLSVEQELDPELGIGVEEITGACLFASWIGGEASWEIARVARWWTVAYLRLFSRRDGATLGEALTILPPFRNIEQADRLRVWLMAYVVEAHSCLMNERPALLENEDTREYCEELKRVLGKGPSRAASNGGSTLEDTPPRPFPALDRQLLAHTELASILVRAQEFCMGLRARIANDEPLVQPGGWRASVDLLIARWGSWMQSLERWRLQIGLLEDLSASSVTAADVGLSYHLARAYLGSLALEYSIPIDLIQTNATVGASELESAQSRMLTDAKQSAMTASDMLLDDVVGWKPKLAYLPAFYHYMIGHSCGLLLLLVQRKWRYLLATESRKIVNLADKLVQAYHFEITSHNPAADIDLPANSGLAHPAASNVVALSRALVAIRMGR